MGIDWASGPDSTVKAKIDIESYALGESPLIIHVMGVNPAIGRMIAMNFSDIEARMAAVPLGLGVSAQEACNAMKAFNDVMTLPNKLHALKELMPMSKGPNHPDGWYRQFENQNKRRNFK